MNSKILLEIIVASSDDAIAARAGGADRFEVCSALALGGLTPSLGTIKAIKEAVDAPAMCMLRPREGGMAYGEGEFKAMLLDAEHFLDAGADGLVFGLLTPDGDVDLSRCRKLLQIVEAAGRPVQTVFHRAFDVTAKPEVALEQLVDLGVTRILTSGRAPTAIDGVDEIRKNVEQARGRIEILPGGELDVESAEKIVQLTGVEQVHLYVTRSERDRSTVNNPQIYFGAFVPENEFDCRVADEREIARIRTTLDRVA
jgi:copper homeostasis protein